MPSTVPTAWLDRRNRSAAAVTLPASAAAMKYSSCRSVGSTSENQFHMLRNTLFSMDIAWHETSWINFPDG